ncbi:MAG TPA: DinB family protein [Gemmataceae bacterium]
MPPWAVLRHVVNHTTYHRGQVASKLKRFGVQQPETDLIFWAFEQIPQPA